MRRCQAGNENLFALVQDLVYASSASMVGNEPVEDIPMAKRKQIAGPELREFIERIRRAYATSNMSFEALAERARGSVDPATIQRLLKGNLMEAIE